MGGHDPIEAGSYAQSPCILASLLLPGESERTGFPRDPRQGIACGHRMHEIRRGVYPSAIQADISVAFTPTTRLLQHINVSHSEPNGTVV